MVRRYIHSQRRGLMRGMFQRWRANVRIRKQRSGAFRRNFARIPGIIVPDQLLTSVRYTEQLARGPTASSDDYQFNLNSIFDPNRTGTGHQPLGHDQLNLFYNRYRVVRCKYHVMINNLGTNVGAIATSVVPTNSATTLAGTAEAHELPYLKQGMVSTGRSDNILHLRGNIPLDRIYGVSRQTLKSDDRYAADFGSSPAEIAVLHCVTNNFDTNNLTYYMQVELVYTIVCFDRIQLAAS